MDDIIYSHDLNSYKSVGNCLTTPFEDLLSAGFGVNNSNSNTDEKTASVRKNLYSLTWLVKRFKQIQKERNNYDKIEKEYYL